MAYGGTPARFNIHGRFLPLFVAAVTSELGKPSWVDAQHTQGEGYGQEQICATEAACLDGALEDAEALEGRSLRLELLQKPLASSLFHEHAAHEDSCNLCAGEQRWVFIISSGRTGSTSLLEMLNAIPGFYVAGENFGLMSYVRELYENNDMQTLMAGVDYSIASFYHEPISRNRVLCSLQSYVKAMIGEFERSNTSMIGFKEIRHHTAEELDFFLEVFPCARFVINTRADTEALHASRQMAFDNPGRIKELQSITDTLENWQAAHYKESFLLRLEDFTLERFNEMLAWLRVTNCQYTSIAQENYNRGYWPGRSRANITGQCKINLEM